MYCRHELSSLVATTAKPSLVPLEHLRKYTANEAGQLVLPAALVGRGGAAARGGGSDAVLRGGYNGLAAGGAAEGTADCAADGEDFVSVAVTSGALPEELPRVKKQRV